MKTIAELEKLLESTDLQEFEETIIKYLAKLNEDTEKEVTLLNIAAALLKGSAKDDWKKERVSFSAKPGVKYQRFFINLGEKDRASKNDIMDLIISHADGLTKDDFADVYTLEVFSFFEAPVEFAQTIVTNVNGVMFKDREVHVELSEKKDRKSGGDRGRGGDRGGDRGRSGGFDRGRSDSRGGERSFGRSNYSSDRPARPSYPRRDDNQDRPARDFSRDGGRPSYPRRDDNQDRPARPYNRDGDRPSYPRRDDNQDRPARSFNRDDSRPSYPRRDDSRPSYPRRDDSRPSYPRRDDSRPQSGGGRSFDRKPRFGQDEKPKENYFSKSYESSGDSPKSRFLKSVKK